MSGAFDAARDVIFANEDRAEDAQYFEGEDDDEATDCRVILAFAEPNAALFQTDAVLEGNKLWVRQSELGAKPPEGARFVVGARNLKVRTSRVDGLDLWWACDVDEIAGGS